jgi:hypothetical protein
LEGIKQSDANAVLTLNPGATYRVKVGKRKFALIEVLP